MPVYHKLGLSSKKTHAIEKKEVFTTNNFLNRFHGNHAYTMFIDPQVKEILKSYSVEPKIAIGKKH
jgi:homogentisate 1,2-dioxygenase